MFRKKVFNNSSDQVLHKEEKERMTHHFHRSLKCLQQKEHIDGATIFSNEASNNLCNVLEAVFLHGVKDNVYSKLVSYAQGIQGYKEAEVKLNFWAIVKKSTQVVIICGSGGVKVCKNFWAVVKKFTHQDVIAQLQQLSQITSDIGLCRAWVRLAINDGLMASYLASMTADVKALRTFYHPWAYMLDYEQPEILRNHFTGLMSLHFNLSSNSSVLNKWSSTTLELANLTTENLVPPPVIRSGSPTPPSSRRVSAYSITSMESLQDTSSSTSTTTITTANSSIAITTTAATLTAPSHTSHVYTITSTPPNTPANPSLFPTTQDLEALKRLAGQFRSSSASSGSSSLASSCPDPSEPHPSLQQHHDAADGGGGVSVRSSRSNSPRMDRAGSRSSPSAFKTREESQLEEELKLKLLLDHLDRKQQQRMEEEDQKFQEAQERKKKEMIAKVAREQKERKERERKELEEQLRLQKQAEEEWLRQPEKEKEAESGGDGSQGVGVGSSSPTDVLVEELKEAMISSDEAQQKDSGSGSKEEPQDQEETDIWARRSSGFGNSLCARDGWTTASPLQNRDQSYESMLKGYHEQQGGSRQMANLQDVIDKLPNNPSSGSATKDKQNEPFEAVDMSDEDIDFADYEIIHSASDDFDAGRIEQMRSLCKYRGKKEQHQTCATPSCEVGVGFFHGPGIIDEFDGKVYCEQCHLNQQAYIPAEIVFNWNFNKLKVCAKNFTFLQRVQDQHLLEVDEMCQHVYNNIPALKNIMLLRTQLTSLRSYMFTCSESTARQLKDKVWPREHLYDKVHSYTVTDLLEVRSSKLELFLKEVVDMSIRHVYSCSLCQAKGFYCELCRDGSPIFPFDIESTVKCKVCKNVYHTKCKRSSIPCPKCARWMERGMRRQNNGDDDYACSPN